MADLLNDHANEQKQTSLMDKVKEVIKDMLDADMETVNSETSYEPNLMAALKIKHTVRKVKKAKE